MRIGIVIADELEYNPFCELAKAKGGREEIFHGKKSLSYEENGCEITAVQCGIGKVNAAAATAFLIGDKKSDVILNAGLSGAVSGLKRGDVVASETLVECDFDLTTIGYRLGEKPGQKYIYEADSRLISAALEIDGVKKAKLGTGDMFLTDKQKGQLYHETFGINAFDMETAAIASVCEVDGVPFLSVRKISDTADDAATDDYREMNNLQEADLTVVLFDIIKKIPNVL